MEPALKQRLVGAAVLVALAIIFLPMLIQGPAPESGIADVPLDAPRPPQGEFETRDLPLVAPEATPADGALGMDATPATAPVAAATTQVSADPALANPDAADLAATASAQPAPATTIASKPLRDTTVATAALPDTTKSAPAQMLPAPTAGGNYVVNFGSYSTAAAADKLVASLRTSGLSAKREGATVNGKAMQRVRIGPYATRAEAESARLKAAHVRDDVKAQVVALDAEPAAPAEVAKPTQAKPGTTVVAKAAEPKPVTVATAASKPASTPAASGTGFAVQLAAFSKAADANALRDRLRAAGFSAFTEVVNTDKGTLTRVRVGPVLNRAEADQLKAQVKSKVGLDGVVRPHP
ncbi:SPOR domain-containing protein [Lysobacter sp. KIS68-7]|uniref:SPOR domain-containing protein n=1 Tax=Lysobacter sp. KIS68-7 TaxID=2904252 RepID=UPI001E41342F|nr:SPOR domain-containing protein [Lysobacter sp. KIS68-7]UHQ18166.1 SPOR domain-containing protein [Lysobacter sp. KIS68-7]